MTLDQANFRIINENDAKQIFSWNPRWKECPKTADLYIGNAASGILDLVWFNKITGSFVYIASTRNHAY